MLAYHFETIKEAICEVCQNKTIVAHIVYSLRKEKLGDFHDAILCKTCTKQTISKQVDEFFK